MGVFWMLLFILLVVVVVYAIISLARGTAQAPQPRTASIEAGSRESEIRALKEEIESLRRELKRLREEKE